MFFLFWYIFFSLKNLKIVTITILILCPLIAPVGEFLRGTLDEVTDLYWFGEFFYSNTFCQSDALFMGVALAIFDIKQLKPYLTFFITAAVWLFVGLTCFIFLRKAGYFLVESKSLGFNFPASLVLRKNGVLVHQYPAILSVHAY